MRVILLYSLTLLLLAGTALGQLNSHIREEFHDAQAYGVKLVEQKSSLRAALHDEKVRIIAFQSFGETLEEETVESLMEWVRAGGTVWFYDARLAHHFGMEAVYLTGEEFRNKDEEGVLGGRKRQGIATVALSIGSHPVQTSVGQVTVFLPELKDGKSDPVYGAVKKTGDTVGLLQFELDSPALTACRREGHGFIVFKSLLWDEPLSGERFQSNLLEFSAGYGVPGPAGVGLVGTPPGPTSEYVETEPRDALTPVETEDTNRDDPETETSDSDPSELAERAPSDEGSASEPVASELGPWSLELKDGTIVSGEWVCDVVEFETGSRSLKLKTDQIKRIEFGSVSRLDRIVTERGEESSGLLLTSPIRLRTERGVEKFEKEDLNTLSRSE